MYGSKVYIFLKEALGYLPSLVKKGVAINFMWYPKNRGVKSQIENFLYFRKIYEGFYAYLKSLIERSVGNLLKLLICLCVEITSSIKAKS